MNASKHLTFERTAAPTRDRVTTHHKPARGAAGQRRHAARHTVALDRAGVEL